MTAQWVKAQDTFIAQLGDGSQRCVTRGEVYPAGHELVKRDREGSGTLFKPLDSGEDEAPAKSGPAKADAPPEPEVKAKAEPAAAEPKAKLAAAGRSGGRA